MKGPKLLEVEIWTRREDCEISSAMEKYGLKGQVINLNVGPERTTHMLEVPHGVKDVVSCFRRESITVSLVGKNKVLATSNSCETCRVLARKNTVILSEEGIHREIMIYRILTDRTHLRKILQEFDDEGIDYKILREEPYVTQPPLTPRESEILIFALLNGYFDTTRKITLSSIAENFSIRSSTVDIILRRALKKVVEMHMLQRI